MSAVLYGDIGFASSGALVSFKNKIDKAATATQIIVETEDTVNTTVAAWGPNNDYPHKLLKDLGLNGAGLAGLNVNIKTHYGGGFVIAEETYDADDKRIIKPKSINQYPNIKEFWNKIK